MAAGKPEPVIDFDRYIAERTQGFTGRAWAFEAIAAWLDRLGGPRVFVLTGEPGSGKTALAARLVQLNRGETTADAGPSPLLSSVHSPLQPGFLSAFHFCSARDSRWIRPHTFAESLALQLAYRYPAYAEALAEKSGDRHIEIKVRQEADTVSGQVIGVIIEHLDVSRVDSADEAFGRIVREPLERLFRAHPDERLVILVDSLDEALGYSTKPDIVALMTQAENLPAGVRFIVTTRPEPKVLVPLRREPHGVEEFSLSTGAGLRRSQEDVESYTLRMLDGASRLAARLAQGLTPIDFAAAMREKSGGNFLYVRQLLKMLSDQQGQISLASLDRFPSGLDGIYAEFLERLVGTDEEAWAEKYAPVLGALAVAREALTEDQVAGIAGMRLTARGPSETALGPGVIERDLPQTRRVLARLGQLMEPDAALPESQRAYTLYHSSLADFLLDSTRAGTYWCEVVREHERIANYFLTTYGGDWLACGDDYALRHTWDHLREVEAKARSPRPALIKALAALEKDENFAQAQWLADRTRGFVGRERVFERVDAWLRESGPSVFLLTGGPGTGKTMLACQLVRMRNGAVPTDYPGLGRGWLAAYHVCEAIRDSTLNPQRFVVSLSQQLARHYPAFEHALRQANSDKPTIHIDQHVEHNYGQVAGVMIDHLVLDDRPKDAFDRLVRAPLEALYSQGFREPVVILIDALDEALTWSSGVNIVTLLECADLLPPQVRWVLTSRTDQRVLWSFQNAVEFDLTEDVQGSQDDVRAYANSRLSFLPEPTRGAVADLVAATAQTTLLHAKFLVDTLLANPNLLSDPGQAVDAAQLTVQQTLDQTYRGWLAREVGHDSYQWPERYRRLLGLLAVAREPLSGEQLVRFAGMAEDAVWNILQSLQQFLRVDTSLPPSQRTYTLFHRTLADFLLDEARAAEYWCDPEEAHARIVATYRTEASSWKAIDWSQVDDYGLSHVAAHLYELGAASASRRHQKLRRQELYDLIGPVFIAEKARRLASPQAAAADVALALEVARSDPDAVPETLARLMALQAAIPP
jgi:AAA ATPase domain